MRAVKALASLRVCAASPELSLLADVIRTEISCAGSCFEIGYNCNEETFECITFRTLMLPLISNVHFIRQLLHLLQMQIRHYHHYPVEQF